MYATSDFASLILHGATPWRRGDRLAMQDCASAWYSTTDPYQQALLPCQLYATAGSEVSVGSNYLDLQCSPGYEGRLCSSCLQGYGSSGTEEPAALPHRTSMAVQLGCTGSAWLKWAQQRSSSSCSITGCAWTSHLGGQPLHAVIVIDTRLLNCMATSKAARVSK